MIDCQSCVHMHQRVHPRDDKLHCYMFEKPPEGDFCGQFTRMEPRALTTGFACVRGVHTWFRQDDALKCCNGWMRVFEDSQIVSEKPRRVWARCDHSGAVISDHTGRRGCSRCGTRLAPGGTVDIAIIET